MECQGGVLEGSRGCYDATIPERLKGGLLIVLEDARASWKKELTKMSLEVGFCNRVES